MAAGFIKPSVTQGHESGAGTQAYVLTALAAGASLTLNGGSAVAGSIGTEIANLDAATKNYWSVKATISSVFGAAVAATSGVQINAYRREGGAGGSRVYGTAPDASAFAPAVVSTTDKRSLDLDGSQDWQLKITNTDATNGVSVAVTLDYTLDLVTGP